MDFDKPPGQGMDASATKALLEQEVVRMQAENAQELLQKMTDKCFAKCVPKPGTALDNSDQKCIAMCMDRYMDAFGVVQKTFAKKLQEEQMNG